MPKWVLVENGNLEALGTPAGFLMATFPRESWPKYLRRRLQLASAFLHHFYLVSGDQRTLYKGQTPTIRLGLAPPQ